MIDLVPGSRIGEKHSYIRLVFRFERAKLTSLFCITTDTQIRVTVLYFEFQVNIAFVLLILSLSVWFNREPKSTDLHFELSVKDYEKAWLSQGNCYRELAGFDQ
jgi:hypothetical protein